jgi:hypothetical protein
MLPRIIPNKAVIPTREELGYHRTHGTTRTSLWAGRDDDGPSCTRKHTFVRGHLWERGGICVLRSNDEKEMGDTLGGV